MKHLGIITNGQLRGPITMRPPNEKDYWRTDGAGVRFFDNAGFIAERAEYTNHLRSLSLIPNAEGFEGMTGEVEYDLVHKEKQVSAGTWEVDFNEIVIPVTEQSDVSDIHVGDMPTPSASEVSGEGCLKEFVVVFDDATINAEAEIWTKSHYDLYVKRVLQVGACPAVRILATFNLSDDYLKQHPSPSIPIEKDNSQPTPSVEERAEAVSADFLDLIKQLMDDYEFLAIQYYQKHGLAEEEASKAAKNLPILKQIREAIHNQKQ